MREMNYRLFLDWWIFRNFIINHESQWEFVSETLGHHNQGWQRNLHFECFLSIWFLKALSSCVEQYWVGFWVCAEISIMLTKFGWRRNQIIQVYILWRFYINMTGCVRITGYWSDAIFIISLKGTLIDIWKSPYRLVFI